MAASTDQRRAPARLRCGIVLHVQEDTCQVLREGQLSAVPYAKPFPSPRTARVSPGHLVAVAVAADGTEAVVWRWYDAVVLGEEAGLIRLWEPAHGEVAARPHILLPTIDASSPHFAKTSSTSCSRPFAATSSMRSWLSLNMIS